MHSLEKHEAKDTADVVYESLFEVDVVQEHPRSKQIHKTTAGQQRDNTEHQVGVKLSPSAIAERSSVIF